MKRTLKYLIIFSVVLIPFLHQTLHANAAAGSYDYDYDNINFYRSYGLHYHFENLTLGASYQWRFQRLDSDGLVIGVFATREFFSTTTTTVDISLNDYDIPVATYSPIRVIDNYGNILAFHFVAPDPGSEWPLSNGNTLEDEKQSPGGLRANTACIAPPYNDTLHNGWHHTGKGCSVSTTPDGYAILHYRTDYTAYPSGDQIIFDQVSPVTNGYLTIETDELLDYNSFGHGTTYSLDATQGDNFIVLNTSGTSLPFVDSVTSALVFTAADNPLRASFDPGAYSCSRYTSGAVWISDCESLFLVSNDSTGNEWSLNFRNSSVVFGNSQTMNFQEHTSEIHDAYSGSWTFEDTAAGLVSAVITDFSTAAQQLQFTVPDNSALAGTTSTGTWTVEPNVLNTQLALPSEMYFYGVNTSSFLPTYEITDAEDFVSGIQVLLDLFNLDNEFGHFLFFVILYIVGAAILFAFHIGIRVVKIPGTAYGLWYVVCGGLVAYSLADGLFNIVFIVTAIVVIWSMVSSVRNRSAASGADF